MGLLDVPFVAVDTETTGLGEDARLVEVGAVRFRMDEVEEEWVALCDPGVPISAGAAAVHGLTDRDVRGRPRAGQVLPALLALLDGAAFVAHHAPFDVAVLARELLACGLPLPDVPVVDTCALPRTLGLATPNHRLATLACQFGVRLPRAHRALADARAARGLLLAYLAQLGGRADRLVRQGLTTGSFRELAGLVTEGRLARLVRRARAESRPLRLDWSEPGASRRQLVVPLALYRVAGRDYLETESADPLGRRTIPIDALQSATLA